MLLAISCTGVTFSIEQVEAYHHKDNSFKMQLRLEKRDSMAPEDRDIEPFDWLNRFFGRRASKGIGIGFPDIFEALMK